MRINRNGKIILNRLKLYLNIVGYLSEGKLGRILSDVEVSILPKVFKTNPNSNEWMFRKKTANRFISYIKKKQA